MNSEEYAKAKAKFSSANDGENGGAEDISHQILSDIYELESKGLHRECAIYISEQLHLSLHYNTLVSRVVFKDLDFSLLSTWSMIALLRNTFWSRDSLARWYDLLDYTVRYYEDNHLNKNDLFGLIQIHKERTDEVHG